jgi:hypothetical protein
MASILDGLASQLQGDTLTQMSERLGADEQTTAKAVSLALPVLLSGLSENATSSTGAQSLAQALDSDHDGSLLDNLPAVIGAQNIGSASPRALNGDGILGHIFGGRRQPVEQGIGNAAGLSGQQVSQLMMMLAPIVMSYLGRRKRETGIDAAGVGSVLREETDEIERRAPGAGGILGQILAGGQSGQGAGAVGDLARMAPNILGSLFGRR